MYTLSELQQMIFIDIETSTRKETFQEVIDENPALEEANGFIDWKNRPPEDSGSNEECVTC